MRRKVKIEIECFIEDVHNLDRKGFKYIEDDEKDEAILDELAQIKLATFLSDSAGFRYVHVTNLKDI